jgi:nucleotide-binding universal stress UspA family protein
MTMEGQMAEGRKILVAADGSKLSRKALDYAIRDALTDNAVLYLLYVLPKDDLPKEIVKYVKDERFEGGLGKLSSRIVAEAVLKPLADQARRAGVKGVHARVLRGDPADEIVNFARDNQIDLLVLGSRGRSKIGSMLLGSVSNKVCQMSICTTVAVK